jgi:Arc/MetJ-type ribon-helix-helix transcriptional regulator
MKTRITVCVEEETLSKIQSRLDGRKYRNKSHFVECAIEELLEEGQ